MAEKMYYCTVCEKQKVVKDGDPIPFCCGRDMEPLPSCTLAPSPEMARNSNEDSPCDDGTQAGRRKRA